MHSVTRLTCTFWVAKSVWANSAGVLGRPPKFSKWNFSYFIEAQDPQLCAFWTILVCLKTVFNKIWRFFISWNRQYWRALIWQKFRENNNRQIGKSEKIATKNIDVIKLSSQLYFIEAFKDLAKTFGKVCLQILTGLWNLQGKMETSLVLWTENNNFDTKRNVKSEFSIHDLDLIWDVSISSLQRSDFTRIDAWYPRLSN